MKRRVIRVSAAAFIYIAAILLPHNLWQLRLAVFLAAYLTAGAKVVYNAIRGVFRGQMLDENFLMSIASIGAFILGEYPEAAERDYP